MFWDGSRIRRHRRTRKARKAEKQHRRDFPFERYPEEPGIGGWLPPGGLATPREVADWTWNASTMTDLPAVPAPVILPPIPPVDTRLAAHGTDETPLRQPRHRLLTPGAESAYDPATAMNRVYARRRGDGPR